MRTKNRTHEHSYARHPRLETHVACTVCGFAVAKSVLRPLVLDSRTSQITTEQREQLRPLVEREQALDELVREGQERGEYRPLYCGCDGECLGTDMTAALCRAKAI